MVDHLTQNGGDKQGMTRLRIGLKRGRNALKGEAEEVMTGWMLNKIMIRLSFSQDVLCWRQ